MKKIYSFILAAVLCCTSNVWADELTVANGESTATGYSYLPYDGNNGDRFQRNQIVYPKSEIADLAGKDITSLKFYVRKQATKAIGATVQIGLAEISDPDYSESSAYKSATLTIVKAEDVWNLNTETIVVEFSEAFNYSGEGHLLIDVQTVVKGGTYVSTSFYGKGSYEKQQSVYGYSTGSSVPTSATGRSKFIPKTTFTYEEKGSSTCEKPANLTKGTVDAHSASFSWDEVEDANWQYICLPSNEVLDWNSEAVENTNAHSVTIENLKSDAAYKFYVRRYCSEEDQSKDASIAFTTEKSCFAPTLFEVPEAEITSESAKVTWHGSGKGETQYQYTYDIMNSYSMEPNWDKAELTDKLEITLTGLTPTCPYQVWVRSYCSEDDQSTAVTAQFVTKCGAKTLPYAFAFDDEDEFLCWTTTDCASGSDMDVYSEYFKFNYTYYPPQYLISPEFIPSEKKIDVSFDYKAKSDSWEESFHVGYSTTNIKVESFTWGDEIKTTSTTFVNHKVTLPENVKYVAIKCTSDYKYELHIDNFSVAESSAPTGVSNTEVKTNASKRIENGVLIIDNNGTLYNAQGTRLTK